MEDHDVNMLFFWDKSGKLIAMTIDVPCPAQEVENRSAVNADYWHPVREKLKQRFGPDLCVLGWIGAAGDQSPRPMYRKAAEERMIKLRNLSRLEEIARRIVLAVEEAYETVKNDRYVDVKMIHKVETLSLPMRLVTEKEYLFCKGETDNAAATDGCRLINSKRSTGSYDMEQSMLLTVSRSRKRILIQKWRLRYTYFASGMWQFVLMNLNFLPITGFGFRHGAMHCRHLLFSWQGAGSYLPTEKAVKGGGYSAVVQSNLVGPEGGQILVDRTVELINSMWPK